MSKNTPLNGDKPLTPAELHSDTLGMLDAIQSFKGGAKEIREMYASIIFSFKGALLYGHANSAGFVGYLKAHGLGCKKDMSKAALWLEIGAQLGDPISLSLKRGIDPDPDNLDMAEFLSAPRFTQQVTSIASKYVAAIRENVQKHGEDKPVENFDLAQGSARFEHALYPDYTVLNIMGDDGASSGGGCPCSIM